MKHFRHVFAALVLLLAVLPGMPCPAQDNQNSKALNENLLAAARNLDAGSLSALLKQPVQLEARGDFGFTPLIAAAFNPPSSQTATVVNLLLRAGADVRAQDDYGETALQRAVSVANADLQVVRLLLSAGAAVDHKDRYGRTALFLASQMGNAPLVTLLIQKGAQVNSQNVQGETPLIAATKQAAYRHLYARKNKQQVPPVARDLFLITLRFLLAHGADVSQKDVRGYGALQYAYILDDQQLVRLLKGKTKADEQAQPARPNQRLCGGRQRPIQGS